LFPAAPVSVADMQTYRTKPKEKYSAGPGIRQRASSASANLSVARVPRAPISYDCSTGIDSRTNMPADKKCLIRISRVNRRYSPRDTIDEVSELYR
jgi:hypothetical protein